MLESTFNDILHTRMSAVPVLNPALSVQALEFCRYQHDWLGALITPWFMNLLLLPAAADSICAGRDIGSKFSQSFPYGQFEFVLAKEEQLGSYAQCSLFSPMFQFEDQAAAVATAQAALTGLLCSSAPRGVSRRDLLRGKLVTGNA